MLNDPSRMQSAKLNKTKQLHRVNDQRGRKKKKRTTFMERIDEKRFVS